MTDVLLKELAEQIVREHVVQNWKFWLLLLGITLVAAVLSAFVAAYASRRAHNLADRADLDGLVDQLRATTAAAEKVRVDILHADWHAKEWKVLRRTKLEELFSLVYETKSWVVREQENRVFSNNKPELSNPTSRLEILARLYFPDLVGDVMAVSISASQMCLKTIEAQAAIFGAGSDAKAHRTALEAFRGEWTPRYEKLLSQIGAMEKRAPDLIKEVMGV